MQYLVRTLGQDAGVAVAVVEANDRDDAARQARAQGLSVLSVSRVPWHVRLRVPGGSRFPVMLFSRELLSLLDSGIAVVEALETLAEKEQRPQARDVLRRLVQDLHQGLPLSSALERQPRAFDSLYVASVRASERTSALGEALSRYVAYATQRDMLRSRLVSAAIYPALLVGVSALVVLFLMAYVVPRFSHIYEDMGGELPWMSRLLLHAGHWLEQYWALLLLVPLAVIALLAQGAGRALAERGAGLLWRIPVVGAQMRTYQLARMYRTLGMLLRGGIPVVQALEMVRGLLSELLRPGLARATEAVRNGGTISQSFEAGGLGTPVALRMLRVGERAGNMGEMMDRIAAFHDEELARWADWATRLIGPVLMLLMGLLIGVVVVLMYLPIFQLAESIQ